MQTKALIVGTSIAAGASAIVFAAATDHFAVVPAMLPMMFVCARWGAGRRRHPMPEAWFEPRNT